MNALPPSPAPSPWSRRMADSILRRYSLADARWHYEHGLVVLALAAAGYPDFAVDWVDHFVMPDGSIRTYRVEEFNLDQVNPARLIFPLYQATGESRYERALHLVRGQLQRQPRNASGGFWHKQIYPHQMWLDGIYMAAPFYARYGAVFGEPHAFDDLTNQIKLCYKHTRDPRTGLLYHGWDASRTQAWANPQTGCSPCFWGRAIGWFVMAVVDILDDLPAAHPDHPVMLEILTALSGALLTYQDAATGMWCQVVDAAGQPGNYGESSVTAMLAYAFAKAARRGWLGSEVLLAAQRAYRGLLENQIKIDAAGQLHLEGICLVAGLGGEPYRDGSYAYYTGEPVGADDFKGVGPFILAALEMETAQGHTIPADPVSLP